MALLLAPYNNAMRIGQGFNSYTQQICIDDAVIMDPERKSNFINNTGMTMEEQSKEHRKAIEEFTPETVEDAPPPRPEDVAATATTKPARTVAPEFQDITSEELSAAMTKQKETLAEYDAKSAEATTAGQPSKSVRPKELTEDQMRTKLRGDLAASNAAKVNGHSEGSEFLKSSHPEDKLKSTKIYSFVERDSPSQIVTYSSRFVSKISEITDDMNISGSLSIKYGTIGGSGRGSFIDASKFAESDLNFYISVKVINQSINLKDSLVYQPLKGNRDLGDKFKDVYGDSFISGFLEGGEFNGLVSMKVLNQAKKTDIAAAAKVALTAGAAEVSAEAQVDIAKQNLHENTETTIQVSWSGGGHIKPRDQPWDIESLMAAAARFPDLVARTPQRTYAILTKYEGLRSFQENKPEKFSPLQYENASLYTNALLDSYMDYKSLYRNLADYIIEIEEGTRRFIPLETSSEEMEDQPPKDDDGNDVLEESGPFEPFSMTVNGLNRARIQIRKEMCKIVKEVDVINDRPEKAQETDKPLPFQTPVTFRKRLPKTELLNPASNFPLSNGKLRAGAAEGISLYPKSNVALAGEALKLHDKVLRMDPRLPLNFRMDALVGASTGEIFNHLEVLRPEYLITEVEVETYQGAIGLLKVSYSNGVVVQQGCSRKNARSTRLNLNLQRNERITACCIEAGIPMAKLDTSGQWVECVSEKNDTAGDRHVVTSIKLYTNRGQKLDVPAGARIAIAAKAERDGVRYEDLHDAEFDPILAGGDVKGFWGWTGSTSTDEGTVLCGLAPIWGCPQA